MSTRAIYSLNELEMLAQQAARGAGAHPAQAQHFGRAVICHLAAGRDPAELLAALRALPGGPIQVAPIAPVDPPRCGLDRSYAEARAGFEALPTRLACPGALHAGLTLFAQQTYVPASEASRDAGAGAGAADKD